MVRSKYHRWTQRRINQTHHLLGREGVSTPPCFFYIMSSNTSKYPLQPPFTQAIALYGDRVGSKGTFEFAGFAWIHNTKVILVQGNVHNLSSAAEWRYLLRLTTLAHRLKKPIVLWNLPVAHIAGIQRRTSLAAAQTIQKTELALLRLPYPIIAVFDENCGVDSTELELGWSDGIVIPALLEGQFSERQNVKSAQQPTDVASAILELIHKAEKIPATELVKNRQETLR